MVLAFQTTVITTVDRDGRVNAAPFGPVYSFSTRSNSQILVDVNSRWHTAHNIDATEEFVIHYASVALFEQVAETDLLYNEGVNELNKAGLTPLSALAVKPPRIEECLQHIECRLNHIIRPNQDQINFIGAIVSMSINEDLSKKSKPERVMGITRCCFWAWILPPLLASMAGSIEPEIMHRPRWMCGVRGS